VVNAWEKSTGSSLYVLARQLNMGCS